MTLGYQEEWSPKQLTETAVPLSILSCKGHGSQNSSAEKFPIPIDCQPGAPKKRGLQSSLQITKKLNNGLIHVTIFVLQPSLLRVYLKKKIPKYIAEVAALPTRREEGGTF